MKKGIIILIILAVILVLGIGTLFFVKGRGKVIDLTDVEFQPNPTEREIEVSIETKDEAEAKEIAAVFGIEFIEYYRGYGVYKTTKKISELYEIAEKNGYPLPEISGEMQLFE